MSLLSRLAHSRTPGIGAAAVALCLGAASMAYAQQPATGTQPRPSAPAAGRPATAPAPATSAPVAPGGQMETVELEPATGQSWTKLCGDKTEKGQTCFTTREFMTKDGRRGVALAVYDTIEPNKSQKMIRALLPLGFKIPPGIRATVDKGSFIPGRYEVCIQLGCYVDFDNAPDLITQMKKGKLMTVTFQDIGGRSLAFTIPVEGFAAAFDGEPVKLEEIQAERKKLEEDLVKKSEEMRKQLLEGGGATPATPAK